MIDSNISKFHYYNRIASFFNLLEKNILLTYYTTFNLGDFYVTTVVVQMGQFQECRNMPIAFKLHERKYKKSQTVLCSHTKDDTSQCEHTTVSYLHRRDGGCANAPRKHFLQWNILSCCNRIVRNIMNWSKNMVVQRRDHCVQKKIKDILNPETDEEYTMTVHSHRPIWSKTFSEHLAATKDIQTASGWHGHGRHKDKQLGINECYHQMFPLSMS